MSLGIWKCSWTGKSQLLTHVRGTLPACSRKRREQGSDPMGIAELQTTRGKRGKKEVKDRYICTPKDEDWGFGAQVPSWLDDLLFQSLHARKTQRWAVTLSGWPFFQRGAPLWKLCQLEQVDVPCNIWGQGACQNRLLLQHRVLGKDNSGNSDSVVVSSAIESRLLAP